MSMSNVVALPRRKALASVRKGVMDTPIRCLIYASEKTGKSTFAAGAPAPIFLSVESGTERLDVARIQPTSWAETLDFINDLAGDAHDYKTLVIDPINLLEPMVHAAVIGDSNVTIEEYGGGYGKGHAAALSHWRQLLFALEKCWKRGMHIVMTAHSQVKSFQNPEGPSYDRYELAMNAKAAGIFKQWADAVLFARLETFAKLDPTTKKMKGYSSGARMLHTQPCAAYDAGTRWKLPDELPLSWDDFYQAVRAEETRVPELLTKIDGITKELDDAEVSKFSALFVEQHKGNADRLAELANRLSIKLDEKKKEVTP